MRLKTPFSFQVIEGWDRRKAERIIDLVASGRFRSVDNGSTREICFTNGTDVAIDIATSVIPEGAGEAEALVAVTGLIEAALSRTDDEHLERSHLAHLAHETAARLEAPEDLETRKMNFSAATPAREAVFGTVQYIPGGWSVRPVSTPDKTGLPSIVSIHAFHGGFQFARQDTRVHDVEVLDPMSRLRMEAGYADLMARVADLEGIPA